MAKTQKKGNQNLSNPTNNYEVNSYWYRNDVTTNTYFNILCDYKIEQLIAMIQEPMLDSNNELIRRISRRFYSSEGIVRQALDYIKVLPSLDYIITSYANDKASRLNKEVVRYVMKKIRHKQLIRDAILKGCIDGVAFYYLETTSSKKDNKKFINQFDAVSITEVNALKPKLAKLNVAIKSLPTNYCRIIGTQNNAYVVAFDLSYFDLGTEGAESKLRKYPPEFAQAYHKWKTSKEGKQMFILDNTKTIVHKISSNLDEPWGRPLALAAIKDILYSDDFINTKRNMLGKINNQIIYETFPEGKNAGTSSLTGEQQKKQHNAVNNAVKTRQGNGTVFFSVAAGTKIGTIDINTDLFDSDYEKNLDLDIGTDLGIAISLLNGNGANYASQQMNLELLTAKVFEWIDVIATELNKAINYNVLGLNYVDVEINYLPITSLNREKFFNIAKDLFTIGRGSLAYLANCAGLSKEVYFAMLDEQLDEKVLDKYPVNATSYNTSGDKSTEQDKGGRPTEDNPTNENTLKSQTNNSNNQPKPNS